MTFRHWRLVRAFTIVELLVVMAIIALLVALIILSLSRARQHPSDAVPEQHPHRSGLAISIYANDHRELPPAERPAEAWAWRDGEVGRPGVVFLAGQRAVRPRADRRLRAVGAVVPGGMGVGGRGNCMNPTG